MHTTKELLLLMKGFCAFCLLLLFVSIDARAQYNELGVGFGAMSYTGELEREVDPADIGVAFQIFYRANFSPALTGRLNFAYGQFGNSDDNPLDAFAATRDASFDISVSEASGMLEYYFLDYQMEGSLVRFSPYVYAGVGLFSIKGREPLEGDEQGSRVQPMIPFGLGMTYMIGKKFEVGIEAGARKTFTDYLDNLSGGDINNKNFQYGNDKTNDWYYMASITVSYTFWTVPCPFNFNSIKKKKMAASRF